MNRRLGVHLAAAMSRHDPPLQRPLHLPSPPAAEPLTTGRQVRARRRRAARWRQGGGGLLLGLAGAGILVALMRIPERLDTLLLVSNAIANVIAGLSRLGVGVLQLAGVLAVVLLTLLALLLLVGGAVRLLRALSPRSGTVPPPAQRP